MAAHSKRSDTLLRPQWVGKLPYPCSVRNGGYADRVDLRQCEPNVRLMVVNPISLPHDRMLKNVSSNQPPISYSPVKFLLALFGIEGWQ
jgi:hypothetical protein